MHASASILDTSSLKKGVFLNSRLQKYSPSLLGFNFLIWNESIGLEWLEGPFQICDLKLNASGRDFADYLVHSPPFPEGKTEGPGGSALNAILSL